jgi:hypothetical protein
MIRSVLALVALLAFMAGSGTVFACNDPMHVSNGKQTLASTDGKSDKQIVLPSGRKDG